MTPMTGIDISKHNGVIDFTRLKDNTGFAILRAGFGGSAKQKDSMFERYYEAAKTAGIPIGCYWYSYAETLRAGVEEAYAILECLKGKSFEFPIYYDVEEKRTLNKGRDFCSALVDTVLHTLEVHGAYAGLYISRSPLQTHITPEVANNYTLWIAEYNSRCNYSGKIDMWQYSCKGRVDGISSDVDMDKCYVDFPTTIKRLGLNRF